MSDQAAPTYGQRAMSWAVTLLPGQWDQATQKAWAAQLDRLPDQDGLLRALRRLVDGWRGSYRPSWGDFMELYEQATPRHLLAPVRHEEAPVMSFDEYYSLQLVKAGQGDPDAVAALGEWDRASQVAWGAPQ